MGNRRFIVLDIQADYPLENIKPHIFYRITLEISKENRRYFYIFILNGNFYFENLSYRKKELMTLEDSLEVYYCCSIEKVKRFITKTNISHLLKRDKKISLETIDDLRIVLMECGYKREIKFNEFHEAERELKSDFSKWHKYDDFHFIAKKLNPNANPGDVKMGSTPFGSTIILDMISDRRKQNVPDCIKEEIIYWTNTMLEEYLIDIKDVRFLLHAEIEFKVIGTLYRNYRVEIIMIGENRKQLHKAHFCLCDCEKEQENAMEEYFKNELFPDKVVDIKGDSANGTKQKAC